MKTMGWAMAAFVFLVMQSCDKQEKSQGKKKVMGEVRNYFTKEPISGMRVAIIRISGKGHLFRMFSTHTDDSGRYELDYELFGDQSAMLRADFTDDEYQRYIRESTKSLEVNKSTPTLAEFNINPYPYNFARIRVANKNKLPDRDSVMVKIGGASYTRKEPLGYTPWPINPFLLKGRNAGFTRVYKIVPFTPNKVIIYDEWINGNFIEISTTDIPFSATDTPYLEVFY